MSYLHMRKKYANKRGNEASRTLYKFDKYGPIF